jgi:hypothetical protein
MAMDSLGSQCASENEHCDFTGTKVVRYGANGSYVSVTLSGGSDCNNAVFGDPSPGYEKSCSVVDTASTVDPAPITSAGSATVPGTVLSSNRDLGGGDPESWIHSFNYFTSAAPTDPNVRPAGGVSLNGYNNTANYVFGTSVAGATVRNRADLDKYFAYTDLHGHQTGVPAYENGLDGLYNNFRSVFRTYPDGNPESVHVFEADHLTLKAHCSGNNHSDCGAGKIYQGYLRPPNVYRPGSYIEVCYRAATADWSWSVPWMAGGEQMLHNPNNSNEDYNQNNQPGSQTFDTQFYMETDMNDGFTRDGDGVQRGNYINAGVPFFDNSPSKPKVAPHPIYWANSNGYVAHNFDNTNGFEELPSSVQLGSATHCIANNWRDDGSDNIDILLDGLVVASFHQEFLGDYHVRADGSNQRTGMYLEVSDQTSGYFEPNSDNTTDQGHGWDMDIVSIRSWQNYAPNPPLAGSNGYTP